jgi:hypothetical protein
MKNKKLLVWIIAFVLVAGCARHGNEDLISADVYSDTPSAVYTSIPALTQTATAETDSESPDYTLTPEPSPSISAVQAFPTAVPESGIVTVSEDIEMSDLSALNLSGTMLFSNEYFAGLDGKVEAWRYNLASQTKITVQNSDLSDFGGTVSPDHQYYFIVSRQADMQPDRIIVFDNQGNQTAVMNWNPEWGEYFLIGWLNDTQLILTVNRESTYERGTQLILDPFKNQVTQIIKPTIVLNLDFLMAVNNSQNDRVVYYIFNSWALCRPGDSEIIWQGDYASAAYPVWSENGERFYVALTNLEHQYDDIWEVQADGEATQLTDFRKNFPEADNIFVDHLRIAPGGKYLSFILGVQQNDAEYRINLMIFNLDSHEIWNTGHRPIFEQWSPDGDILGVTLPVDEITYSSTDPYHEGINTRVVLIDPQNKSIAEIAENTGLIAWLR